MKKIKRIDAKDETELESLIINDLDEIEEGLNLLGRQIKTDSGPLDILAINKEGSLVVIELKVKEEDEQLFQGIRYFDWVKFHIEWIAQAYHGEYGYKIDAKTDPSLFLIAPSFSENLKRVARYVDIDLLLYEYDIRQIGNEKKVFCRERNYGEPYEPTEIPTIQGHLSYITDHEIKSLFEKAIEDLKQKGIELEPKKRRITLRYKGDIIGRIRCRRSFFYVKIKDNEERFNIKSLEDWNNFVTVLIPNL